MIALSPVMSKKPRHFALQSHFNLTPLHAFPAYGKCYLTVEWMSEKMVSEWLE